MPGTRLGSIALLLGAAARLRLTRYEIAEHSMEPALRPGDWVLGVKRPARVSVGDVVVVEHPTRPGFRLVKRVSGIGPAGLDVRGDHANHSVDSGTFGPVATEGVLARLVLVYHPRPLRPV
jgi:nickel-type superoxide dismutase maturation protease